MVVVVVIMMMMMMMMVVNYDGNISMVFSLSNMLIIIPWIMTTTMIVIK